MAKKRNTAATPRSEAKTATAALARLRPELKRRLAQAESSLPGVGKARCYGELLEFVDGQDDGRSQEVRLELLKYRLRCLTELDRFAEAADCARVQLELDPSLARAWMLLGYSEYRLGQPEAARQHILKSLEIDPDDSNAHFTLGLIAYGEADYPLAETSFRKAIQADSHAASAVNNLANVLIDTGRAAEAREFMEAACAAMPEDAELLNTLGLIYHHIELREPAKRAFRRAGELQRGFSAPWTNLGKQYLAEKKPEEALPFMQRAVAENSNDVKSQVNLAINYGELYRIEDAIRELQKATAIDPTFPPAHHNLSTLSLIHGDFELGWREYQWRHPRRALEGNPPRWAPYTPPLPENLDGQWVFVKGEQGLGDEIFFMRFVPLLKARGARIAYRAHTARLIPLLRQLDYIDFLVESGQEVVSGASLSCWSGDLPYLLGMRSVDQIPPSLTLAPDPATVARLYLQWFQALPPPYVGITWRAGLEQQPDSIYTYLSKSAPTEMFFDSLRDLPGTVIVMQRNPKPEELALLAERIGRPMLDCSDIGADLEELLALLFILDDLVGVSNTNVHMRAALGKGGKVIMPLPSEIRWMEVGKESPWFPGYRIYRERYGAGWDEAFADLRRDLLAGPGAVDRERAAASAERSFRTAIDAYMAGNAAGAIAGFRECLAHLPDHAMANQNLGVLLLSRGDVAAAEPYLWKAFELNPNAENGANLATLMEKTNRPDEAERIYRFVLDKAPAHAPILFRLGELSKHRGDATAACDYFRRALEADPANLDFGIAYAQVVWDKEPAETIRVCEQFLASSLDDEQRVRVLKTYLPHKEFYERMRRGQMPYHAESLGELFFTHAAPDFEEFCRLTRAEAERKPQDAIAIQNLAIGLFCAGDRAGTEACLRRIRPALAGHVWEDVTFDPAFYRSLEGWTDDELTRGLPAIESVRSSDFGGRPAVYLSCDGRYFESFGIPLIRSALDKGERVRIHVHVMDATPAQLKQADALCDASADLAMSVSTEAPGIRAEGEAAARCYYHAIRFVRYYQHLKSLGAPLWLMDVDALFRRAPSEMFPAMGDADVAMRIRPGRIEPWNQFNACVVGGTTTAASIEYFRLIGAYVAHFFRLGALRWGIDQAAMYGVFEYLKALGRAPKLALIDDRLLDYDHRDSGIVWPNSGTKKFFQLAQRSADGTVAADQAGHTEYVQLFNRYAARF